MVWSRAASPAAPAVATGHCAATPHGVQAQCYLEKPRPRSKPISQSRILSEVTLSTLQLRPVKEKVTKVKTIPSQAITYFLQSRETE